MEASIATQQRLRTVEKRRRNAGTPKVFRIASSAETDSIVVPPFPTAPPFPQRNRKQPGYLSAENELKTPAFPRRDWKRRWFAYLRPRRANSSSSQRQQADFEAAPLVGFSVVVIAFVALLSLCQAGEYVYLNIPFSHTKQRMAYLKQRYPDFLAALEFHKHVLDVANGCLHR